MGMAVVDEAAGAGSIVTPEGLKGQESSKMLKSTRLRCECVCLAEAVLVRGFSIALAIPSNRCNIGNQCSRRERIKKRSFAAFFLLSRLILYTATRS